MPTRKINLPVELVVFYREQYMRKAASMTVIYIIVLFKVQVLYFGQLHLILAIS